MRGMQCIVCSTTEENRGKLNKDLVGRRTLRTRAETDC
jgi:hypothetical protein